ncbi:MAG: FAD-binding protein [Xanthomonadales bacterium]|nr:FAD-binding protein [Gammaproteobacteria bacterium]MBT8049634.1 FAD-binding protein [Gammaproteobacteria bacterium]NNJ80347.1 FAD-binding protein [Xanthomonadales bacterium]NNL05071.1 FAD-binding protein [Xanthomonadales bacterium]
MTTISRQKLLAELGRVAPRDALIADEEALRPFECDGLSMYRELPLLVAIPENTTQLRGILRTCSRLGVPVVTRGAGTGLSGGALPLKNGLLLVLTRLNRILDLDPVARTVRVEPGVRNLAVSEAARPHGLYYAPDPSSQIACSIGGNVAENSGGVHCLKYGLTVHNVLEVTLLTIDGEEVILGGPALDAPGYDLLAVINGSEGMLGVITEVLLRLLPVPQTAQVVLAGFATIEDAASAVAAIISAGIVPAGLEMMDRLAVEAVEAFSAPGYPRDAEAVLLCELDGGSAEVAEQMSRVVDVLQSHRATSIKISDGEEERLRLWAGRKNAFPAVGRIKPDYYCMDGTIPRRELPRVLGKISEATQRAGLTVANVFHAGDGNLHPLIMYDANQDGQIETAEQLGAEILRLCIEAGGTVTGEHGVGMEKIDSMCEQFNADELAQFHALKSAFDPKGLLNPGKAVPTLHRCAELGAMHVHGGKLPFPDIPRF